MTTTTAIIAHARSWAQRVRYGPARVVDLDGLVEALEPPQGAEDELEDLLGAPPTASERALWLGTWRAILRERRG